MLNLLLPRPPSNIHTGTIFSWQAASIFALLLVLAGNRLQSKAKAFVKIR